MSSYLICPDERPARKPCHYMPRRSLPYASGSARRARRAGGASAGRLATRRHQRRTRGAGGALQTKVYRRCCVTAHDGTASPTFYGTRGRG